MSEKEKACETNWSPCRSIVFPLDLVLKNYTSFLLIAKVLPPLTEGHKEQLFITSALKSEWPGIEYPAYSNEFPYDKEMDDDQLLNSILNILQSEEVRSDFTLKVSSWGSDYHEPDEETYYNKFGVIQFKEWDKFGQFKD